MAVALPVYQAVNLTRYVKTWQGYGARAAVIIAFLPLMALTLVVWAAFWIILASFALG